MIRAIAVLSLGVLVASFGGMSAPVDSSKAYGYDDTNSDSVEDYGYDDFNTVDLLAGGGNAGGKGQGTTTAPAPTTATTSSSTTTATGKGAGTSSSSTGKGAGTTAPAPTTATTSSSTTTTTSTTDLVCGDTTSWDLTSECVNDNNECAGTTIKANFFEYTGDAEQGEDCPVDCTGTPADTIYFRIDGQCRQWPGASGFNSHGNGQCGGDNDSFTWDQYLSCDCGVSGTNPVVVGGQSFGATPTAKVLYQSKCIVDTAKPGFGICGQIVDYSACN